MHLLLGTALLLRLGDVMRIDACERHSEYSRVVHRLVAPQSLALSYTREPEPTGVSTASMRMGVQGKWRQSLPPTQRNLEARSKLRTRGHSSIRPAPDSEDRPFHS